METVEETFGKEPNTMSYLESLKSIVLDPKKVWVNYDKRSDSMIMYFSGKPVRSIALAISDNMHLMIDPKTDAVVGVMFEAWETQVVPAYESVNNAWPNVREGLVSGWSTLLQMLLFWFIAGVKLHPENNQLILQPT